MERGEGEAMRGFWWVLAIGGLLLLFTFGSYNSLISLEEQVNSTWAQVDNQLMRRADLIPNLVETVKGYAAHEREVFQAVSDARAKLAGAANLEERAQAEAEMGSALARLLMVVENYPALKADLNFRQLQDALEGTENRIAVARRDYNDVVRLYNTRIRRFPTVIMANLMGFGPKPYFEIPETAREAPKVNF